MRNFIFILLFCISCQVEDAFKSYGKEKTELRQVEFFYKIDAAEKFDVELKQDSLKQGLIEVTAGENVLNGYTSKVKNGVLFLENENQYNMVRKLKVRQKVVIYIYNLTELSIRGSAKFVSLDTLKLKSLLIKHDGLENAELNINIDDINIEATNTGGVVLKGKNNIVLASVDDISFLNNRETNTQDMYLTTFSKADNHVYGKNIIKINNYGTGNTYYYNFPLNILETIQKGSGKIEKR